VDWRREDSAYAAVTVVAAAVVGILIAGNFGLVPSPFVPPTSAGGPAAVTGNVTSRPRPSANAPADRSPDQAPSTETPSSPSGGDNTAPTAGLTTPAGTVVSATQGSRVTGVATDADSGVDKVMVTFTPSSGEAVTVPATVTCDGPSRTDCSWAAEVPGLIDTYEVYARATDRSGNVASTERRSITVVNLGGAVDDLTTDLLTELAALLSGTPG
jgi:hypothetical protein